MEYKDDNPTKNERNTKSKSIVECIAKVTIASLPHIVITLIFLVYLLLGSTILNELEISEQGTYRESLNDKLNADLSFAATTDSSTSFKQAKFESYLLFSKYKLKLNDIYLNVLFNLRKHQSRISNGYRRFLNKLDKVLVDEIYNKTNDETENVGLNKTPSHLFYPTDYKFRKEINYFNTKKFISKVFKIQNDNSIFLLQTIADHLIETKKGLRMNISKNIKQLITGFKRKHLNSEKKLFEFIQNQEDMFKTTKEDSGQDLTNKKHPIEEEENSKRTNLNQFKPNSRTYFKSVFFMAALMSKIGHGDSAPQSSISKLFILTYLIIGLPLCFVFFASLRSIITINLKYMQSLFLLIFLTETYQNRFINYFESNLRVKFPREMLIKFFTLLKTKKSTKPSRKQTIETQTTNKTELVDVKKSNETLSDILVEIFVLSVKQTKNSFDFSVITSVGFLLVYLTAGGVASSNLFGMSLINGYYFILIFLTRIDLNLIEENIQKLQAENSYFILVACFVYLIAGVCLTSLILHRISSEIKLVLYENTRGSILKLIALLDQFGYKIDEDSIDFEFYTADSQNNVLKSTEDLNLDADFVKLSFNDNLARRVSRFKKNEFSDKQTQITTLLCSKLIKPKDLSSSYSSITDTSASVSVSAVSKSSSLIFEPKRRLWSEENLNRRYSSLDPITDDDYAVQYEPEILDCKDSTDNSDLVKSVAANLIDAAQTSEQEDSEIISKLNTDASTRQTDDSSDLISMVATSRPLRLPLTYRSILYTKKP